MLLQVDIVLTAVNMIVPIPSFSAMVAHKFGMRSDLVSYSLGGQGCGAGVLILGLAESLLKVHASSSHGCPSRFRTTCAALAPTDATCFLLAL